MKVLPWQVKWCDAHRRPRWRHVIYRQDSSHWFDSTIKHYCEHRHILCGTHWFIIKEVKVNFLYCSPHELIWMLQKLFQPTLLSIIDTLNCLLFWGACLLLLHIQVYITCNVDGHCLMIFLLLFAILCHSDKRSSKLCVCCKRIWKARVHLIMFSAYMPNELSNQLKSQLWYIDKSCLASTCHELSSEEWTPKRYMLWRDWTPCFEHTNHFWVQLLTLLGGLHVMT